MKVTTHKIKELLASQIGVEPEDISEDDSFMEDLHMTNADLTDFIHKLESAEIETKEVDFTSIETLGELLESLGLVAEQQNG